MKNVIVNSGCSGCPMNRRSFITKGSTAAIGALGILGTPGWLHAAGGNGTTRIRLVYALHSEKQDRPDWPNIGFDFKPVMERITGELLRRCKNFEIVTSMANGEEQAKKILEEDKAGSVDGYIVYQMNCWNRVVQILATSGKPILYCDFQFGGSGGFLDYNANFLRNATANVGFVASSKMDDLVEAIQCFEIFKKGKSVSNFVQATARVRKGRTPAANNVACLKDNLETLSTEECIRQLKESTILAVSDHAPGPAGEIMGIKVINIPFKEVNDAWEAADKDESESIADRWQKNASAVKEVTFETLKTSAAMYLGMKSVMKKHGANSITIDCLGGFYGGHIHAYPCLGFHELNNQALVGACECDIRSAATMVTMTTLSKGRPGYISDPVIDTSKRQIIYAHCVASNKVFGPRGPSNPYEILTHSEDRQGASVRSVMPVGYLTTTLKLEPSRKEIIFHQGRIVANDPDDRACRTKVCCEPTGDIEKLFTQWDQWGWHRVTFFGNLKEPLHALANAQGWKVIEET